MHFRIHPKLVRDSLLEAEKLADIIHENEKEFIKKLRIIDTNRYYVRFGYKSLMGFCNKGLNFSKTQSQRLVTQVRRNEPTSNIETKASSMSETKASQIIQPVTLYTLHLFTDAELSENSVATRGIEN